MSDEISAELQAAAAVDDEFAKVLGMRTGDYEGAAEAISKVSQEARALTEEELDTLAELNEDAEEVE